MRVAEVDVGSINDSIPASSAIAKAGAKRHAEGHLYADDVLESYLSFASLLDLLPRTDKPAIRSIDAATPALSHARLRRFIESEFDLAQFGIGRGDRVALLMPNGPNLALAFVSVLTYCSCAPLNSASTLAEIETDMLASGTKLVIAMNPEPGLEEVTKKLGIVLLLAEPSAEPEAGLFKFGLAPGSATLPPLAEKTPSKREDESFVLFTSGSTGAKKLVPHLLEDLLVGAVCIAASCLLKESDVCCNQMPLYHVGGIARNVLAPILSGGSVVAMPAFEPSLFWKTCAQSEATWYYAGPTMHMLILETYKGLSPKPAIKLRFIANAAGPLLHSVAEDMRDTFSAAAGQTVSIMPSYGMTECMPIASPPVGFALDKVGSSGQIVGPRCEIQDDDGKTLPRESVGHIMVKGHPVMRGYSNNPEATAESMVNGWFRTGDMGKMDADGYLYLTGRSKDVINRGGEIISPIEIEESIQPHPFIKSVAAFHTPHDVLQETVGVLVVAQPGCPRLDLRAVQAYAARSLHPSKWPQLIVYASDLPKTTTGKAMRTNLAKRFSLPEIRDGMPQLELHYEAEMLPVGAPIKQPIPCSKVAVDLDTITAALERPGRDVHVKIDGEGALTAYVTPGSAVPQLVAAELSYMHAYLVPEKIVCLGSIPRDEAGAVDEEALAAKIEKMRNASAAPAGDDGSTTTRVTAAIHSVTNVLAEPDDHLAATGINSLNMIQLIGGLKNSFPEVVIPEVYLLNNPTVAELVKCIEDSTGEEGALPGRDSARHMQMDSCYGLRTILCLWIVRSHIQGPICGEWVGFDPSEPVGRRLEDDWMGSALEHGRELERDVPHPARLPFAWRDMSWVDINHKWRVTSFILLAGMTTAMKYDSTRVSSWQKVKEFVPPLLPILWLCTALIIFIDVVELNVVRIEQGDDHAAYGFYFFTLVWTNLLLISIAPAVPVSLGYTWYLGAQTLFLVFFNWFQDASKGFLNLCCLGQYDTTTWRMRRIKDGKKPSFEHKRTLTPFLKRLAWTSALPVLLVSLPKTIFDMRGEEFIVNIIHSTSWLRLPHFYQGLVLGQGCLNVELTAKEARWVGRSCDILCALCIFLIFAPITLPVYNEWWTGGTVSQNIMELCHVPVLCYIMFAVCRAPGTSWAAWLLSANVLKTLTPYTYSIYMMHFPMILWVQFVRRFNIQYVVWGWWTSTWYMETMGFPWNTFDLLLSQKISTLSDSEKDALEISDKMYDKIFNQTLAEWMQVTPSDPAQTIRDHFRQKDTDGLLSFDYTLQNYYLCPAGEEGEDKWCLPPHQWGCGLGGFEVLGLFLTCVCAGMLTYRFIQEPFQLWYNARFLGKGKAKPDKVPWYNSIDRAVHGATSTAASAYEGAVCYVTDFFTFNAPPKGKGEPTADSPREPKTPGILLSSSCKNMSVVNQQRSFVVLPAPPPTPKAQSTFEITKPADVEDV